MADRAGALGAVLAGERNRRYGSHKALEMLGGRRVIDRVAAPVGTACSRVVVVANDLSLYGEVASEVRPDVRPGLGALGGIYTAVCWAEELGCDVALTVACDMPFVSPELLRRLVSLADEGSAALPASPGPRGFEPLCAAYGRSCRSAIEAAFERDERAEISFFGDIDLRVVSAAEVARYGEPRTMFMNINSRQDMRRAERVLAAVDGDGE